MQTKFAYNYYMHDTVSVTLGEALFVTLSFLVVIFYLLSCRCNHCNAAAEKSLVRPEKMVFDGSIEHIECITQHEDYCAITNSTVLSQVTPLLQNKQEGTYPCRIGVSENG